MSEKKIIMVKLNSTSGTGLCAKRSEVFEGIAHFVKISITIKANGFHIFSLAESLFHYSNIAFSSPLLSLVVLCYVGHLQPGQE